MFSSHREMDFHAAQKSMVERQLRARGISHPKVLEAFGRVARHLFVAPSSASQAYDDHPVSIGEGQTISQPYMVALMTECLAPEAGDRVLEVGTGSGYQTAILAEIVKEVQTIERIAALSQQAREALGRLGYQNIAFHVGDGTEGFPESAPYDGIIVAAGAPEVPQPLVEQLAMGGRLVMPVGSAYLQELLVVRKTPQGTTREMKGGCVFVKLIGRHGWQN